MTCLSIERHSRSEIAARVVSASPRSSEILLHADLTGCGSWHRLLAHGDCRATSRLRVRYERAGGFDPTGTNARDYQTGSWLRERASRLMLSPWAASRS